MWLYLVDLHEHALDWEREYVNSSYDEHIVCPAGHPVHPDMGSSADEPPGVKRGYVPCPVSYDRKSLLGDGSKIPARRFHRREGPRRFQD